MSTFLTQGGGGLYNRPGTATNKSNNLQVPSNKDAKGSEQQLQSSLLYAPFVKPVDKMKKDVAEMSFSDFQPKRFALNYDPPMISKKLTIIKSA